MLHCYFPVAPHLPIGYSLAVSSVINALDFSGIAYVPHYVYFQPRHGTFQSVINSPHFYLRCFPQPVTLLGSLFTSLPYSCFRYWQIKRNLIKSVESNIRAGNQVYLDDFVLASLLLDNTNLLSQCYVRFHDDLYITFVNLAESTPNPALKLLYLIEANKSCAIQRKVLQYSFKTASISYQDRSTLSSFSDKKISVLDLNHSSSEAVKLDPSFSPFHIAVLTNLDSRKRHGINWFIHNVWPIVLATDTRYMLFIAGKYTQYFSDKNSNVVGLGFVPNKDQFYSQYLYFVNPQLVATGVQLKTVECLHQGKIIFTTDAVAKSFPDGLKRFLYSSSDPMTLASMIVSLSGEAFLNGESSSYEQKSSYQQAVFSSIYSPITSASKLSEFLS